MKAAFLTCILAAAALSPAVAQTIKSDSSSTQPLHQHMPMRWASKPTRGENTTSVGSYNWGGYAVTGTDFTNIKGSWIVPTVTCGKSPNAWVSIWVGIDGLTSSTVEQTGTTGWCDKTTAQYFAWYEFYPAGTQTISSVPVSPGNKISTEITYSGSDFTVQITNETTGDTYTTTGKVSGAKRNSAEWIVESPYFVASNGFDYGVLNLADFTKAEWGDDYTKVAGTNAATDSTVSGPISDFGSSIYDITHVDYLDDAQSTSSALSKDGSSFTVTWNAYN
jgi:hypothetical protein